LAVRLRMLTASQAQPLIDGAMTAIDLIRNPVAKLAGGSLSNNIFSKDEEAAKEIPSEFELGQNFPNPFNPTTTISFNLPVQSFVSLKVFDATGREVAVLVSEELPAGRYSRQWNAEGLASGVYFYGFQANQFMETKKLIILK
jgi:hypothetical protein